MGRPPNLAEVHCSPLRFAPGDRILVRTNARWSEEQKRRFAATLRKWAGCEVEVFIYCVLDMDIKVDKRAMGLENRDVIY